MKIIGREFLKHFFKFDSSKHILTELHNDYKLF